MGHLWRLSAGLLSLLLSASAAPRDGAHDFDFTIGTWKMHIKHLAKPLSGSTAHHAEQAFSDDGGKTWEANWIADLTRERQ